MGSGFYHYFRPVCYLSLCTRLCKKNDLVHRWMAYKYIYKPNRKDYSLPFRHYQIHHKDKNKSNNNVNNLKLFIKKQHEEVHKDLIRHWFATRLLAFWGILAIGILMSIVLFFILR